MATRLANLIGAIDGINKQFTTPTPYQPGSTVVRVDDANLDAVDYKELDPPLGVVEFVAAPAIGSELEIAYTDPLSAEDARAVAAYVEQLKELSIGGGVDGSRLVFSAGEAGDLIRFTVFDKDGNRVDLRDYALYFAARLDTAAAGVLVWDKIIAAGQIVLEDQATSAGLGRANVVFSSVETAAQAAKILIYDLWAKNAAGELIPLVRDGRIEVRAAVRTTFP